MSNPKSLDEVCFSEAYSRVMSTVSIDETIKNKLYKKAVRDFIDGWPRPSENYIKYFPENGFQWDTFDYFYEYFKSVNLIPAMWCFSYTNFIDGVTPLYLSHYLLKDNIISIIKKMFGKNINIKTKKDAVNFIKERITSIEHKNQFIIESSKYGTYEEIKFYNYDYNKTKIELVQHNITMLSFSIRYLKDKFFSNLDVSPDNFQLMFSNDVAEQHFSNLWNHKKIAGYPPFFPGDRTCIRLRRDAFDRVFRA